MPVISNVKSNQGSQHYSHILQNERSHLPYHPTITRKDQALVHRKQPNSTNFINLAPNKQLKRHYERRFRNKKTYLLEEEAAAIARAEAVLDGQIAISDWLT